MDSDILMTLNVILGISNIVVTTLVWGRLNTMKEQIDTVEKNGLCKQHQESIKSLFEKTEKLNNEMAKVQVQLNIKG